MPRPGGLQLDRAHSGRDRDLAAKHRADLLASRDRARRRRAAKADHPDAGHDREHAGADRDLTRSDHLPIGHDSYK